MKTGDGEEPEKPSCATGFEQKTSVSKVVSREEKGQFVSQELPAFSGPGHLSGLGAEKVLLVS